MTDQSTTNNTDKNTTTKPSDNTKKTPASDNSTNTPAQVKTKKSHHKAGGDDKQLTMTDISREYSKARIECLKSVCDGLKKVSAPTSARDLRALLTVVLDMDKHFPAATKPVKPRSHKSKAQQAEIAQRKAEREQAAGESGEVVPDISPSVLRSLS